MIHGNPLNGSPTMNETTNNERESQRTRERQMEPKMGWWDGNAKAGCTDRTGCQNVHAQSRSQK
jgi:hypothetical protein